MSAEFLQSAMSTARDFVRYRNPENGRPPMTNWPKQLLGNRGVTASAILQTPDGDEMEIEITDFAPARSEADSGIDESNIGAIRSLYDRGGLEGNAAEMETARLITYLAASISTGQLPSAKRINAESTLKGKILQNALESGWQVESLTLANGETRGSITVKGLAEIFAGKFNHVESEWDYKAGRGNQADDSDLDFLL